MPPGINAWMKLGAGGMRAQPVKIFFLEREREREIESQRTQPSVRSRVLHTYHEFYITAKKEKRKRLARMRRCFFVTHWIKWNINENASMFFRDNLKFGRNALMFFRDTLSKLKNEVQMKFSTSSLQVLNKFSTSSQQFLSSFSTVSQQFLSKCSPTFGHKTCTEIPDFCARQPCSNFFADLIIFW